MRPTPLAFVLAALATAAAAAQTACSSTGEVAPSSQAGGSCDPVAVFQRSGCTACHSGERPSADLDLTVPVADLGKRVLDAPSKTQACAGRRLVDSRAVDTSVLLTAIDHDRRTREGACALAMPPGRSTSLPASDIACLAKFAEDLVHTAPPPEPFEPVPLPSALARLKLLVHGGAVTEEELARVQSAPDTLRDVVDGWTPTPAFTEKMRSFFGTALQQDSIGRVRETLGFPISHFRPPPALPKALARSFVDTALDITAKGRPFTDVVTTRTRAVTTAELVLLAYAEQTEAEVTSTTFKVRFVAPLAKKNVPATLSLVDGVWELGGALEKDETCRIMPGKGEIPAVQEIPASYFLGMMFGHVRCRGGKGDLVFPPVVTASDLSDSRFVTFSQSAVSGTPFHSLAAFRALGEGARVPLRAPRVGFFSSLAFLDNWPTNKDNQYRVTLNQTLNVALGATFSMGDPTPNAAQGIDAAHAKPDTPCWSCHRLMDPMRPLLANGLDVGYRARVTTPEPATFAFFGSSRAGTTADDLAKALVEHPRFATAWVLKVCSWATSRVCSDAEPGVSELATRFREGGWDFRRMLVDTLSSPLVTGLSGTPLSARPEVSIARRRHLCGALRERLGAEILEETGACSGSFDDLARLVTDDAFARGNPDAVMTSSPGTFHAAGLRRLCTSLAASAVAKKFAATDAPSTTLALARMTEGFLGLPKSHPRHDRTAAQLEAHVQSVRATGAPLEQAMQSAFVVACTSPDFAGAGL